MKAKSISGMVLLGAIALTSQSVYTVPAPPTNLPAAARIQAIAGKGKVQVRRDNPPHNFAARRGTPLNQGDLLLPDPGVRVTILCPNGLKRSVSSLSGLGKLCPVWRTNAPRGEQDPNTTGGVDTSIPYLIAPRHTLLLSTTPVLRWNAIAGVTQYQVEVIGPAGTVWKTQTQKSQIVYAGKPLIPGVPYSLEVTTNTGKSSQSDKASAGETATYLDFRILRSSEAAEVQALTAKLLAENPQDETTALMLATYYGDYVLPPAAIAAYGLSQDNYQTYSLSAEAIALLEAQIQQGKSSPLLDRTLGDLYWQIGLIRLAGEAYQQAIRKVQTPEDLEDWTLAYYGLGQVNAVLQDSQQVLQCWSQARIGFLFLGNPDKAAAIQRQLEILKRRQGIR
ncbi:MAG: tetratricopeptide repeat protein [Scytolyngbya sp. HA4215-MV1]|nr:tetratricopeptide repeat protein [Scytolyngbya sp. HA4215-MV1]